MTHAKAEFTLDISPPIEVGGQIYTSLKLREPNVGDILAAVEKRGTGITIKLLACVSGQDETVIRSLSSRQSRTAFKFLGKSMDSVDAISRARPAGEKTPHTLTINLREAIETSGKYCNRLDLHEPTLGEIERADHEEGLQHAITLVSCVSGQIRTVIEHMPITEFVEAAHYLLGFMAIPDREPSGLLN